MGQAVEVIVSELNSASVRLADAGQRLQDGLSSVDLEIGQVLGSGWKGGAASAFGTEWDKWHSGAGQVVRGLQTMSDLLRIAGREYAKTDEQAAGALGSSMQNTGGSGGSPAGRGSGGSGGDTGFSSAGVTGHQQVGELAHQMNLGGAAPSAAAAPAAQFGQALPTVAQAVQGAAGQSTQLAGGLAQQAAALAQQIVELAQQGTGDADTQDDGVEGEPGDLAESADPAAQTAPAAPPAQPPAAAPRAVEGQAR
jgi:WXG100 family type VII secretion target